MTSKKKWLYLPMEIKVREFYGKIFLAGIAADKGFGVVFGPRKEVYYKSLFFPPGIILDSGFAKKFTVHFKRFKYYGHKIVALDEEGLIIPDKEVYLSQRASREALDLIDVVFCWGKNQFSLIKERAKISNCKPFIVGNPRFDLHSKRLRPFFAKEAEAIKEKYGRIILINTNFGYANNFVGNYIEKRWRVMSNQKDKKYHKDVIEKQKMILGKFKQLAKRLSREFKGHTIVIRPHPSENPEAWREEMRGIENIFIIRNGNVIPWIMSAEVLIHSGCTTALEAVLLGIKPVAYLLPDSKRANFGFPNEVSLKAFGEDDVVSVVDKITSGKVDKEISREMKAVYDKLRPYYSFTEAKTSAEKIISIIDSEVELSRVRPGLLSISLLKMTETLKRITKAFFFGIFKPEIKKSQLEKIPDLKKSEIERVIKDFSVIDKRFLGIKVTRTGKRSFVIEK